ncbi:Bro-N domain-containing protein [Streptomyces sp. NPDC052396]|uniref:Bro-N domain-containing protein n=1 Tax=Streptomyces sp. NPDC052396 TaxID=3365689 RepID=UPI0037D29ACA
MLTMSTRQSPPDRTAGRQEAIDVGDFVYAATGARIRRITLPNGEHWFPAVDVCKELGYTTTRKALLDHVPEERREFLETVTGSHSLSVPAGREWRRDLQMVDLQGLILLVNGSTKPSCQPFKQWVAKVIRMVQQDGSYSLDRAEAQPSAATTYTVPVEIAEAIVRLEESNLRLAEELSAAQRETGRSQREVVEGIRELSTVQQGTNDALMRFMSELSSQFDRLADRMSEIVDRPPSARERAPARPRVTAESVINGWRDRNLAVTNDIWAVAAYILPALIESGECAHRLDAIAVRTGLTVSRVHDALRMMLKRGCIRQTGTLGDGTPVYALK